MQIADAPVHWFFGACGAVSALVQLVHWCSWCISALVPECIGALTYMVQLLCIALNCLHRVMDFAWGRSNQN